MRARLDTKIKGLLEKKDENKPANPQVQILNALENNPRCVFIRTDAYRGKAEAKKAFFDAVAAIQICSR